jgi:hypothetical protein
MGFVKFSKEIFLQQFNQDVKEIEVLVKYTLTTNEFQDIINR